MWAGWALANHGPSRQAFEVERSGTTFYVVTRTGSGVLARRTTRPHRTIAEVDESFGEIFGAVEGESTKDMVILVDLREIVGRNDPEFERAVEPHRRRLMSGFGQAGILVASSVGALQIRRMFAQEGIVVQVFSDETLAMRWFRGAIYGVRK